MSEMMNCLIENREFSLPKDGWQQIAPAGEHDHPPSGLTQVIDRAALVSMEARFREEAGQPLFPGLLVDFDHFSEDASRPSEAAGWITELEARDDGLWARIRWSDAGEAAVKGGRYRLVSPVWLASDVEQIDACRIRPLRLHRAALTNSPNLKGMHPLSNRADETNPRAGAQNAKATLPDKTSNHKTKGNMKEINEALGLPPEAATETVLAAVETLRGRARAAEAAAEPLKNRLASLEQSAVKWREEQAEADLLRYRDRIQPAGRDKWKTALLANREAALTLLETVASPAPLPMHRRALAQPPQEGDRVRKLSKTIREYQNRNHCRWQQAWDAVREEQPELFDQTPA